MRVGFDLLPRAAHELGSEQDLTGKGVRRRGRGVLDEVRAAVGRAAKGGDLRAGVEHFLKVTASYEPGLFHCYDVPDLPRTNNDLEHVFGSTRHHERRRTGREAAARRIGPPRALTGPPQATASRALATPVRSRQAD